LVLTMLSETGSERGMALETHRPTNLGLARGGLLVCRKSVVFDLRHGGEGGGGWDPSVTAVPGSSPGIGPGHPDAVKRRAVQTVITGTGPVMTGKGEHE
jgi:hypothetical protein